MYITTARKIQDGLGRRKIEIFVLRVFPAPRRVIGHGSETMHSSQSHYAAILGMIWISVDIYSSVSGCSNPKCVALIFLDRISIHENAAIFSDWMPDQKQSQKLSKIHGQLIGKAHPFKILAPAYSP